MQYIPVLLIDDDELVIQDLKTMVNWEKCGFHIVATACNGKQAIKQLKKISPKLIIVDVVMPIMNGLDFVREINCISSDICILFLTSYAEFSYVKEALLLGVTDYILKNELSTQYLQDKLNEIHKKIELDSQIQSHSINLALKQFFSDQSITSFESYINHIFPFPIDSTTFHFILVIPKGISINTDIFEASSSSSSIDLNYYTQFLKESINHLLFLLGQAIIIGIPYRKYSKQPLWRTVLNSVSSSKANLKDKANSIFFTTIPMTLEVFRNLYFKCRNWISFQCLSSHEHVVNLDVALNLLDYTENSMELRIPELVEYENEPSRVIHIYSKYIKEIWKNQSYIMLRTFATNVDTFFNTYKINSIAQLTSLTEITETSILEIIESNYIRIIENRIQVSKGYSKYVQETIDYLEENYSNNSITIEYIAKHLNLSVSRLSTIFRNETSITILEYLTNIRIQKAIYLLQNSHYKIYEISEMVGYKTSQYFSQIIQQKTGKTPIAFRKNN